MIYLKDVFKNILLSACIVAACLTCDDKDKDNPPKPPVDDIITYEKILGTNASEYVRGGDLTNDGGCIITGYQIIDGDFWAYLMRTNNTGDTLWMRRYRAPGNLYTSYGLGLAVQQTNDGGFIMVGDTQPDTNKPGDSDFYIVKTDANGDTLWTRFYDRSRTDGATSVKQTSDGGYIISGNSARYLPDGGGVAYVFRLTSDGSWVWGRTIDEYGTTYAVEVNEDGAYMITGDGAIVTKIDPSGNTIWSKFYGRPFGNTLFAIDKTNDGGYVFAGKTEPASGALPVAYLVRTDVKGDTLWTRSYPYLYSGDMRCVSSLPDGGFLMSGNTEKADVIRTDSNGDTLWTRSFGDDLGGAGFIMGKPTEDGGFIFAGGIRLNRRDIYLVKTDSLGLVKPKDQ